MGSLLAATVLIVLLDNPALTALVPEIERAVRVGNTTALEHSRNQLRGMVASAVDDALAIERYTLAYVDWRLAYLYGSKRVSVRQARLGEARNLLEQLSKHDPKDAEALSLLGVVYGGLIDLNSWKAMTLGPKASTALATAISMAPNNPRTAMLSGMNAMYTPNVFGGGLDVAERHLRHADVLFAQSSDASWPNWGAVDALAWLGQVLQKKGDRDGARSAYERALVIAPDHVWVRAVLLPSLNRPRTR
jgi:Flp pilus assembly protein TadD